MKNLTKNKWHLNCSINMDNVGQGLAPAEKRRNEQARSLQNFGTLTISFADIIMSLQKTL